MFTQHILVTVAADGTAPLLAASQTGFGSGVAFYSQGTVGLINPSLYFSATGGIDVHGYRLDTILVQQSAPAAGQVQVVDALASARILSAPFADLSAVGAVASVTSRSFPVPPGYLVRVNGANVDCIILSYTAVPAIADVQYLTVTVVNPA